MKKVEVEERSQMEPKPCCGEPVCEDCTLDAPTNYEEAYKALKVDYERLEQGLDHADKLLKQKDEFINDLNSELIQNYKLTDIVLKTIRTIKNNIEVIDSTLQYVNELESALKEEKRKNGGKWYE